MERIHTNTSNQEIEKVGIFDFDINLLHTNTLVHFILNGKEVVMWTREFDESGSFKHLPVSFSTDLEWSVFRNMRDVNIYGTKWPEWFYDDIREAIEGWYIWKSFNDFLEHIKNWRYTMINTARWHGSQTLSEWVRVISEISLSPQEKQIQIEKIREKFLLWKSLSDDAVLTKYFYEMPLHIWTNDPFVLKMNNFIPLDNYVNKTRAIELQIQHVRCLMQETLWREYQDLFEIWFSDDSFGNINAMIEYMKIHAAKLWVIPHIYYSWAIWLDHQEFTTWKVSDIDTELWVIQRITI